MSSQENVQSKPTERFGSLKTKAKIKVEVSANELADQVATLITQRANEAQAQGQRFSLVLSGGRTPQILFEKLVDRDVPWHVVDLFWGDERMVPPDHKDSNFGATRVAMIDKIPLSFGNIHRIRGEEENPNHAAALYEKTLRTYFGTGKNPPRFDLVLLGMGGDGHTASLFPGNPLLLERDQWVSAFWVEKMNAYRISLLPRILNTAKEIAILVTGTEKVPVLKEIFSTAPRKERFPVESIRPEHGELTWYFDREAATGVPGLIQPSGNK